MTIWTIKCYLVLEVFLLISLVSDKKKFLCTSFLGKKKITEKEFNKAFNKKQLSRAKKIIN